MKKSIDEISDSIAEFYKIAQNQKRNLNLKDIKNQNITSNSLVKNIDQYHSPIELIGAYLSHFDIFDISTFDTSNGFIFRNNAKITHFNYFIGKLINKYVKLYEMNSVKKEKVLEQIMQYIELFCTEYKSIN